MPVPLVRSLTVAALVIPLRPVRVAQPGQFEKAIAAMKFPEVSGADRTGCVLFRLLDPEIGRIRDPTCPKANSRTKAAFSDRMSRRTFWEACVASLIPPQ